MLKEETFTPVEQRMMETYIRNFALKRSDAPMAPLNAILREWATQKQSLFELFGNKMILEKKIELEEPEKNIKRKLNRLVNSSPFINGIFNVLYPRGFAVENSNNIVGELWYDINEELLENKWTRPSFQVLSSKEEVLTDFIFIPGKNFKPFIIQKGTKLTTILSKFAKALQIEGYDEFMTEYSKIFNTKITKGTFCLSIHPLDFMTMSDNASNWSSCMSWRAKGDYRDGTVEMLNSPCVVVGYLKSDSKDMPIGDDYWNNKKWRELFIVTEEVICGVKGYPYRSESISKIAINWLKELADKNNYGNYADEMYRWNLQFSEEECVPYDDSVYTIEGAITDYHLEFSTVMMYNDFYYNTGGDTFGYLTKDKSAIYTFYSGAFSCMACGAVTNSKFYPDGVLIGDECLHYGEKYCEYMSAWFPPEQFVQLDGESVSKAYYNICKIDCITGKKHLPHNMQTFVIQETKSEIYLCKDTSYESFFGKMAGSRTWYGETINYLNLSNCSREGINLLKGYWRGQPWAMERLERALVKLKRRGVLNV